MIELSSDPRSVSQVEVLVNRIAEKYQLDKAVYGNLLISLTEAVSNAIIHGNRRDRTKKVRIGFVRQRHGLVVKVSDQGPGFDPHSLPDPTAPENIACCGGRGVFLMRELADECRFHDGGKTVEMSFKI
jgi:serine/threonine-protein kinase RsbW